MMRLFKLLMLTILLVSCNGEVDPQDVFGIAESEIDFEIEEIHTVKIVDKNTDNPVSSLTINTLDTIELKAVLVNSSGSVLQEVAINWGVSGDFSSSDLTGLEASESRYATFTGNVTGSGFVNGVVTDVNLISLYSIKATSISTGTINVQPVVNPDEIIIHGGDQQTGQVGSTLSQTLKAQVRDQFSQPIAGISVSFSVTTGGGQIVSVQPVVTDASGIAECTVKVGGIAGVNSNTFTATMATGTITSVLFRASSIHGPAAKLSISQHPDGGNVGTPLNFQPVIEVHDSYGNLVSTATNDVSVTVNTGSGNVSGTTTVSAVDGVATFLDIVHDIYETGVDYEFSSPGLTSIVSNSFDIGQININAQCVSEGAGWQTMEGGCKDLSSGLVWSAVSAANYTWHQAVWDVVTPGSSPQDSQDEGRTTDNDPTWNNINDGNALGYCHDLVESGYSDWVLPRRDWFNASKGTGAADKLKEVDINGNAYTSWLWTSSDYSTTNAYIFANNNFSATGTSVTSGRRVRCVRFPAATQLFISQQPDATEYNVNGQMKKNFAPLKVWETQPAVQVRDATNSLRAIATNPITVSLAVGTGTIHGTTTVNAIGGVATFTDLYYDKAETITLKFSSPGFPDVLSDPIIIHSVLPKADCVNYSGMWKQGAGGCKDISSGLIYSTRSLSTMNWNNAIWDSTLAGASAPDSDDQKFGASIQNEYQLSHPPGTYPANSGVSYCHDLVESGYTDWILPRHEDLYSWGGKDAHVNTRIQTNQYIWTAATNQSDYAKAMAVYLYATNGNRTQSWRGKTEQRYVHCVRRDPPDHLRIAVQVDGGANGLGSHVEFLTQPKVEIVDYENSPHYKYGVNITASLVGGTGSLLHNGVEVSSVTLSTDNLGQVQFSGLAYNKPGETIKISFQAEAIDWKGTVINLPAIETNDIVIPAVYGPSQCVIELPGVWETSDGGCRDLTAGGVVYSNVVANGVNWYNAVWDSTVIGAAAADAYDGGAIDDYDPAYPAPATYKAYPASSCHNLMLNGYKDWRMPTYDELDALRPATRNGADYINLTGSGSYIWSSTPGNVDSKARMMRVNNWDWPHNTTGYDKNYSSTRIICVRTP